MEIEITAILFLAALAAVVAWALVERAACVKTRAELDCAARAQADASAKSAASEARADAALRAFEQLKAENSKLIDEKISAQKEIAATSERLSAFAERIEQRERDIKELREKLSAEFELLSNKIFEAARAKMSNANAEQIGAVIAPLKSNITEFRERLESLNTSGARNAASMEAQIKALVEMSSKLGDDANNLASALRSNNKAAGNWGETVLERIFESCGFKEGVHYFSQKSYLDKVGSQQRLVPDFVVRLPDNRSIVVDSKLSLVDFVDYSAAEDAAAKRAALAGFKKSVRAHLGEFADKYDNLPEVAAFKVMFMPVEPAYELAIAEDPKLVSDAYEKNVLIAGPVSIMAILKFADIAYRNEAFEKNIKEICIIGKLLYERIELFAKRFEQIGARIAQLEREYGDTRTTLSQGGRSVLDTAKRFYEKSVSANIVLKDEESKLEENSESEDGQQKQ